METTGYEYARRPNREERDFVETRQKTYRKYHITAISGLQIVPAALTAPDNNDTTVFPAMPAEIRHRGFDFTGNLDGGCGSDYNYEPLSWMGMIPNIRQRKDAVNRGRSHGRRAAGLFGDSGYGKRAPIGGIFGPGRSGCTAGSSGRMTGAGSPREGRS